MTLTEKISQMVHGNVAIERIGVPAYNWWNEACHGIGRSGRATVFPQVIGMGATWNRALVQQVASVIADEARAKHHAAVAAGRRGQYQGLTFWTPNINIFRDPRWGRGQETFGEDPYLMGELGVAMVRGLQGDDPTYYKTAACAKHFAVHSGPERERHSFDARPSQKDLSETYLPAFEKLVRAGVESVMGAYNRMLGEVCCGSRLLLVEILRKRWGFKGHVVSDCAAIDDFHLHHKVTKNSIESAALAVRNGCDLNCGCTYNDLLFAVKEGLVSDADIDTSVRRLLTAKFRLGLFDPPARVPWSKTPLSIVDSEPHRALSRRMAVESIVLLKNNGILPLRADYDSVLVAGPTGANTAALLGDYYGVSPRLVSLLEGITERAGENCRVNYRAGCPILSAMAPGVNYTYSAAAESEITIAVLGYDPTLEGEEVDARASPTDGDRDDVGLPKVQREFPDRAAQARGEAGRRSDRRKRDRGPRGPGAGGRGAPGLVSGLRGRPGSGGCALRRRLPVGEDADHGALPDRGPSGVRRLRDEGPHLPVRDDRASLPVRLRVELRLVQVRRARGERAAAFGGL